jgi:hypothetical protein
MVRSCIKHQPDICEYIVAFIGDPISLHLNDQRRSSEHLFRDHITSSSVDRNNNSLGLFNIIYQYFGTVGHHLLLRVPGVLDRRRGVGHVGSHTTNTTTQWRGLENIDQLDPLLWEIQARPIGFMQW